MHNNINHERMMRIRAKEQLPTPKSQAEYLTQIQRKIDEAWNILLEVATMAKTLNDSCDDKTQYEAYNTTLKFEEDINSINSIIEDDLNIEPIDFTHYVEEEDEITVAYAEKEKLGLVESDCEPAS